MPPLEDEEELEEDELDDEELPEEGETQAGDWNKQLPTPFIGQHVIFPEVHPLTTVPVGQLAISPEVQQPLDEDAMLPLEDEELEDEELEDDPVPQVTFILNVPEGVSNVLVVVELHK